MSTTDTSTSLANAIDPSAPIVAVATRTPQDARLPDRPMTCPPPLRWASTFVTARRCGLAGKYQLERKFTRVRVYFTLCGDTSTTISSYVAFVGPDRQEIVNPLGDK